MSVDDNEIKINTAVGNLLMRADDLTKRVLTAFDPSDKRTANYKALNSFNLDILEPCAAFLGIELADSSDNKIFTKDSLVNRILLGIRALLPSHCSECAQQYVVDVDPDTPPHFTCHMCYQSSHDCDGIKALHDALKAASISLLSGHVWLCSECLMSSNPVKPRKSKSRHNSVNKSDPSLTRIRNELKDNDNISSPQGQSPGTLKLDDENHKNSTSKTLLNKNLQHELDMQLQNLSRERVCPKYRNGKCPHGLRGNKEIKGKKCELQHPKRCFKFCKFGDKHKHGCKRGESCEYYHPALCRSSVQSRRCTKKKCTFVHLKGTRRKDVGPQPLPEQTNNSCPNPTRWPRQSTAQKSEESNKPSESEPFLELKKLVLSIQSNFQQEISAMKASFLYSQPRLQSYFNPPAPLQAMNPPHQFHQVPPGTTYIHPSSF